MINQWCKARMVEKKEGATMVCVQCGVKLVCGMSKYPHPYKNKLQWQNSDGSAHYKYDSGKFSCTGEEKESNEALFENGNQSDSLDASTCSAFESSNH